MDTNPSENYIWYHDLKWKIEDTKGSLSKTLELSLSDHSKIEMKVDSLEKLKNIIKKLENSI